ncbi:MAG: isomerase, partial [Selenomonadaceae bacterium]|nr:isomerase [Selenomonadaceae bacterium]
MKLSMNEATALNCQAMSLEQDILLAEKYGYDMIEPRTMDRMRDYLAAHSIEELADFFKAHNIEPLAFNTLCFFNNRSPEGYQGILDEL